MRIILSTIGKLKKNSPEYKMMSTYLQRSKWSVEVKEYEEKRALTGDALKQSEADLLLSGVPEKAKVVVLDEHGDALSSREFAGKLRTWQNQGTDTIAFLIGGADVIMLKKRISIVMSFCL